MANELKCTKRVSGSMNHASHVCGKPAEEYEVTGKTYSARAVLCEWHRKAAINQGFTLKLVNQNA